MGWYWKISWRPSVCLWSAFPGLFGSSYSEIVCCRTVSSGGSDLSCGQHDRPSKSVIESRCRWWEEKFELKLWCQGCVFAMWCWESSSGRSCESGLASLYAIDKLSTFHSHKGGGNNNSSVYLDFGCLRDVSPIPHIPVESVKGCAHFCESVHLIIHDNKLIEGTAKVGELFYSLQSLSLDGHVGFPALAGASLLSFLCWWLGQNCHRPLRTCQHCFAYWLW